MRIFIIVSTLAIVACSDVNDGDMRAKVCGDLSNCLSSGSWTTDVESFFNGQNVPSPGSGGVITFKKDMTGTTTEVFLQGYADGNYFNDFTYEIDDINFTLTISYELPSANPTQSEIFKITSAYENEIRMERPIIDGKLIFILTK